jgi:hypothetical protein
MPPLHTHHDRMIHRLRQQIAEAEAWLEVDEGNKRAAGWHRARLAEFATN